MELLAIPAWNTSPTPLSAWVDQLTGQGLTVALEHESSGVTWLEIGSLRLRGYAVIESGSVEAINFELHAQDTAPSRDAIERAAEALGWEVHEDDEEDIEDD
jgi:hypothetical protein